MQIPATTVKFEDAVLVRQVQAGEVVAFADLVRKYQDRVYNTCLRICGNRDDASDLAQEAFLKAFESIDSFRGKSAFYTWLFRIAVNMSISYRRKRLVRNTLSLDDPVGAGSNSQAASLGEMVRDEKAPDPVRESVNTEAAELASAALLKLEADQRAVIVLRDIEGFDYQEIADILELPVGTVKSRLFRGRTALRDLLKNTGDEESE